MTFFYLMLVIQVSGSGAGSIPLSCILERVSEDWYELLFKWLVGFTMEPCVLDFLVQNFTVSIQPLCFLPFPLSWPGCYLMGFCVSELCLRGLTRLPNLQDVLYMKALPSSHHSVSCSISSLVSLLRNGPYYMPPSLNTVHRSVTT